MIGDLTRSIIRLPRDMSAFGMQYLAKGLFPNESYRMAAAMGDTAYTGLRAAEDRIGHLLRDAITIGDYLGRGTALEILQQTAETVDSLIPGQESHIAWLEFQNKLQAYGVFEYVESVLQLPAGVEIPLAELVDKALALEPYTAVWATEGVGHLYAERCLARSQAPGNLLNEEHLSRLPSASLITLHAGMGLSFANHLLQALPFWSSRSDIRRTLYQFLEICHQNSRPGYAEIAIEALGLVGRTLYPRLVPLIDQELADMDLDMLALFWHGVGRGLYFLPVNFVPYLGSGGRAVEMALQEAPHRIGRLNAVSGVAWPLTLVNIRHPQVMETFLKDSSALISDNNAFAQGVSTAILTWYDSTPDDPALQAFIRHRPDTSDQSLITIWDSQVRVPCDNALRQYYPVIKKHWRLGELFRYQSLSQVAGRLQQEFRHSSNADFI